MLGVFRDLLEDYFAPSKGRVNTSGGYCSAGDLRKSVVDRSKQKIEIRSQEERAERASMSTETETEARRL